MMDEKAPVNSIVEGVIERLDRINRRLICIVILLIVLLVGSNVGWLIYESQFQVETTETEVRAFQLGSENLVSGGDLTYGTVGTGEDED